MNILQLSLQSAPNIGGLETHLSDLTKILSGKGFKVFVLCYQPLSTKTRWKIYEKCKEVEIFRIPWFFGFFYILIPFPKLEFLYLFPGLFLLTPILLTLKRVHIIHAHGLIAGAVAVFWGKLLKVKVVISTHSIYSFPKSGIYKTVARLIFGAAEYILCLSEQSLQEVYLLGIQKSKIHRFTYWIDLKRFRRISNAKKKLKWTENFIVLFVGRLIPEKGIEVLLKSVEGWNNKIKLVFVGSGPLEKAVRKASEKSPAIHLVGKINQDNLPVYYSAADCVIVPSVYDEGFGRVIIESLACSTPVIASNRGATSEVIDETVGRLIDVTHLNIKKKVEYFFRNPLKLKKLADNARNFTERRYSEYNANKIIDIYNE